MNLKLVSWNCRGLSNPRTMDRIKDLMRSYKPDFICLLETKLSSHRIHSFCVKFNRSWAWAAIPSLGLSGGILVLWKKAIGLVTPVASSRLALHLVITSDNISWILTSIYNSQALSHQKRLWRTLSRFSALSLPWLLNGDFNAILNQNEHFGGSFTYYASKSTHFSEFIFKNSLHDLEFSGSPFTWCNGRSGLACRWARLDRFLANTDWILNFHNSSIAHLPRINSDHSPLFLSIQNPISSSKKIFHFDNFWLDYEGCHNSVISAWSSNSYASPLQAFSHAISRTKSNILRWKKSGLCHIDIEIKNIQLEISMLEESTRPFQDSWHDTWLRALYNRFNALTR